MRLGFTLSRSLTACAVALAALVGFSYAPSHASAQQKVLRIPSSTGGPGTLDPCEGSTVYDNRACSCFYETLLQYKYLKRPLELEPLLLTEMPRISDDGLTWRFTLKKGIRFADDPCFPNGKGRELTAHDVEYSWKRLADPAHQYKSYWLLEGLIKGLDKYRDEQRDAVNAGKPFDYNAPVEGIRVINDHELEIDLTEPNQQFIWRLSMFQLSIVPREAVEKYGIAFAGHPVGSGPFILQNDNDWTRGISLFVNKNPNYHEDHYPSEAMPEDKELGLDADAGKILPLVDRVEMYFFVEPQPMWLEFKAGKLDYTTVGQSQFEEAFSRRTKELKREWRHKGIREVKVPLLDFIFRAFNMEDPFLGGYTDQKRALRQALNLAMDWDEMNETLYNGMALCYDGCVPPGLDGFPDNPNHRAGFSTRGPDYERARAKLRDAGFTIGSDGRVTDLPPIEFYTSNGQDSIRIVELMQRNLREVGIQLNPHYLDFAPLMDVVDHRRAPMFSFAWGSDYPDAENNLSLFYSKNKSPGNNHSNYDNPDYDAMYEQIRVMPAGPERTAIIVKMRDLLIKDAPFCGSMARTRQYLVQPWLKNFKPTEDFWNYLKYLDVDMNHADRPQK